MQTSNNTILITGGATGIGLSLAIEFLNRGNEIIICGRRENILNEVKVKYPKIHTYKADISKLEERKSFVNWIVQNFPKLNILINNAGIQREFLMNDEKVAAKFEAENEIESNLTAPIHLTMLLLPHLRQQQSAVIINVTSGLAYVPHARMPVYCATKSAMQSFTKSLRHQLKNDNIKVFEVAPPIVDTDLDKGAREKRGDTIKGIKPEMVAKETMRDLMNDKFEIAVGRVKVLKIVSRILPDRIFNALNGK
jgi:uncharacterized oxidoreductase